MQNKTNKNQKLEALITEIQELLYELKNDQTIMQNELSKHHKVTMHKLQKLKEFNEITDMTNQIFERRLYAIENKLNSIIEKKRVK